MEAKHTAGPWTVTQSDDEFGSYFIDEAHSHARNESEAGEYDEANDIEEANARLIAAAPDMYEALRGLAAICMPPSGAPAYHDSEWVTVRAALAKAEGR